MNISIAIVSGLHLPEESWSRLIHSCHRPHYEFTSNEWIWVGEPMVYYERHSGEDPQNSVITSYFISKVAEIN